jgi:hypothetical protein
MPKISELTSAATIAGTETIPVVQSATTKKVTAESLLKMPIAEIDLGAADYTITKYGLYYITEGSSGLNPNVIILPNPTTMPGTQLIFFNYDTTNDAYFQDTYQPYLEASTSGADKYTGVPPKQAVLVISINGYWSALNFRA